jgi:putative hydrolase of the HAD superfamily
MRGRSHRRSGEAANPKTASRELMSLHLLIDADDTLWENNIYFERAFEEFVALLGHSRLDAAGVRAVLDEIEVVNNRIYGYGSRNFARNLEQCFVLLAEREVRPEDLEAIRLLGERLLEHPMEIIEGVPETLEYLERRHELVLFTKGQPEEQRRKLERSGLSRYFRHAAVVKEKEAESYRKLVADLGFDPERCWMIGNSPKSDVNAALEAGLRAVFIPHDHTWTLEREPVREAPGRMLQLNSFAELRQHF